MTHDLSIFFENNKLLFTKIDPCNLHLLQVLDKEAGLDKSEVKKFKLILSQIKSNQKLQFPKVWLHGVEHSLEQLFSFAKNGTLVSLINQNRCIKCLKLDKRCTCEPEVWAKNQLDRKKIRQSGALSQKVSPVRSLKQVTTQDNKENQETTDRKENVQPLYKKSGFASKIGKGLS